MNNRDKKLLVIICALIAALAVVLVGVFISLGNDEDDGGKDQSSGSGILITEDNSNPENQNAGNQGNNSQSQNPGGNQNADILTEGFEIKTPCGTIFYPAEWEEYLKVENVPENGGETIKFHAEINGKTMHLFNLNFGIAKGSRLGTVNANGKIMDLYFEVFETEFNGNWTNEEINDVYSMQEGINILFAQLYIDTSTSPAVEPSTSKVEIETPYGKINFPGEWEEYLYTEIDNTGDYTVKFYADIYGRRYELFDIYFGEKSDSSLGKVSSADGSEKWLNITIHEFVPGSDTNSEDADIVYGMQEASNEVIEQLIG